MPTASGLISYLCPGTRASRSPTVGPGLLLRDPLHPGRPRQRRRHSSVAIGTDGLGIISYSDSTQRSLSRWPTVPTSPVPAPPPPPPPLCHPRDFTSVTIGIDGFGSSATTTRPVATSRWPTARTCLHRRHRTTLDSAGNVGRSAA